MEINDSLNIFEISSNLLVIELSSLTNQKLLDKFSKTFVYLNDYAENSEFEKTQILEIARAYKDEIVYRLKTGDTAGVVELAKRMQDMLQTSDARTKDFYGNTLLRIYSRCIQVMRNKGIDKMYIKEKFL